MKRDGAVNTIKLEVSFGDIWNNFGSVDAKLSVDGPYGFTQDDIFSLEAWLQERVAEFKEAPHDPE